MRASSFIVVVGICLLTAGHALCAELIAVPNASFESPPTSFVSINIDSWEKTPKPEWYNEGGGFLWTQLTGAFKNTPESSPDHILNCDGNQAIWLFAVPEVGLYQDLDSEASTNEAAGRFEVGKAYQLTVAVMGSSGGMAEGASLELSLYYRDASSNRVTVAATSIVHSVALFPTNTWLTDFQVRVPQVQAGNPWAGQPIGVQFLSTVSTNLQRGYWDLDNVRLASIAPPALEDGALIDGQFRFTVRSEPGTRLEVQATTNTALPSAEWSVIGTLTNVTGTTTFTEPAANIGSRFYRLVQLP